MRCWAFSQYEQGGYPGSPILSSAVLSTRDHRGAGCALPRPAPDSRVPLANRIEHTLSTKQEQRILPGAATRDACAVIERTRLWGTTCS